MKKICKYLQLLCHNLRMVGIPCDVPAYIFGGNKSVLCNTSIPDSRMKKKYQSIDYHLVHEGESRYEWRTLYVNMHDNESDLWKISWLMGRREGFLSKTFSIIYSVTRAAQVRIIRKGMVNSKWNGVSECKLNHGNGNGVSKFKLNHLGFLKSGSRFDQLW